VVVVGEHLRHRKVRAAHAKRLEQPAAHEVLPRHAGQCLHHVAGHQVAEIAVLELLAQVLAQRQEPQGADELRAGPAWLPDPGQVVPGQPGAVRQQVGDRQAVADKGIVQPDLGDVIPQRPVPVEQFLIDEGADGCRGERLRRGPDGEERVLGDGQPGFAVPQSPAVGQLHLAVPDGGDRAPGNLPRG
jgi:hypothetical protein